MNIPDEAVDRTLVIRLICNSENGWLRVRENTYKLPVGRTNPFRSQV